MFLCFVAGVEFGFVPKPPEGVPLVADMSSNMLSRPVDVSKVSKTLLNQFQGYLAPRINTEITALMYII